eukprot:m.233672 g.233672  ORF g.233672 m.233672 type:complete len:51 (+) comp40094_c0_seq8:437-589(+)
MLTWNDIDHHQFSPTGCTQPNASILHQECASDSSSFVSSTCNNRILTVKH